MEKELPSKFRFKANGYYYLAELSTQADAYNLSTTDEHGRDIRNLNNQTMKELVQAHVKSGHWKIIEEPFELPSKFTFIVGGNTYTAIEQEDRSYVVWFEKIYKYEYSRDVVERYVKQGEWVIQKEVEAVLTSEPTLLDAITEFTNTTNSNVTILPNENFYISCGFLGTEFEVDNKEELKQLMAAATSLWNVVNGKK